MDKEDKEWWRRYSTYIQCTYNTTVIKNEIMPFAAMWMDLESVTEWHKSDIKGEILYDIPYMWNLGRNDTNELNYQVEKDSHT